MRPWHRGYSRTSTAKRPTEKLRPRTVRARALLRAGFSACRLRARRRRIRARLRREARSPRGRGCEHARVFQGVEPRRRHAGRQTTERRQRVHVDGHRPVGVGLLQRDADQAIGSLLETLLPDGRPQHVAQQRIAADGAPRDYRPARAVHGDGRGHPRLHRSAHQHLRPLRAGLRPFRGAPADPLRQRPVAGVLAAGRRHRARGLARLRRDRHPAHGGSSTTRSSSS